LSPESLQSAISRLGELLAEEHTRPVVEECLKEAGLAAVGSAEELLRLARALTERGGFVAVVGRELKVQALLAGASEA
jgi:hypothetical protein